MKTMFGKSAANPRLSSLLRDLRTARGDLTAAYQLFNQTTDPELIDFSVYQISAGLARCDYLIRSIKACGGAGVSFPQGGGTWT